MDFIFADDARQLKPSRVGVGPLVAIGGVGVRGENAGHLELAIEDLCERVGFPKGEQFKWSPGKRESFMRRELHDDRRVAFYRELLAIAAQYEVSATVVIEDTHYRTAREDSKDHEHDITALFLERADREFSSNYRHGLVVIAAPSGGDPEEERFLAQCLELLEQGTEYQSLGSMPLGVFIAKSRQVRLLQLADVITSCVLARVAGEVRYSQEVFDLVKPLLREIDGRIGGAGVKLHPDYRYANLYYWLLGDKSILRGQASAELPDLAAPFAEHPNEPIVVKAMIEELTRARRASSRRVE